MKTVFYFLCLLFFPLHPIQAQNLDKEYEDAFMRLVSPLLARKTSPETHIKMPVLNGAIVYQYTSPMDSSLSKEKIYRCVLNWYYKTYPYGHSNLIESDLHEGTILARGEYTFPYSTGLEDLKMKLHYMLHCSIRYGKYRIRFYEIEPEDQVQEENDFGKIYSHFEPRDLMKMYETYLSYPSPPEFAVEKMEGIHRYFMHLLDSFSKTLLSWTRIKTKKDF